jgi:hypothetical protein
VTGSASPRTPSGRTPRSPTPRSGPAAGARAPGLAKPSTPGPTRAAGCPGWPSVWAACSAVAGFGRPAPPRRPPCSPAGRRAPRDSPRRRTGRFRRRSGSEPLSAPTEPSPAAPTGLHPRRRRPPPPARAAPRRSRPTMTSAREINSIRGSVKSRKRHQPRLRGLSRREGADSVGRGTSPPPDESFSIPSDGKPAEFEIFIVLMYSAPCKGLALQWVQVPPG